MPGPWNDLMHRTYRDDASCAAGRGIFTGLTTKPPDGLAGTQELASEVDVDDRVPVLERHLGNCRVLLYASIGHHDIDPTEGADSFVEEADDGLFL